MPENPYKSPAPLSELGQFYTDDITLMPMTVIWRTLRRQSIVGCILLFPYFMARRLLRLRFRANYGISRATELPIVPVGQIPADVAEAFKPYIEICNAHQMEHIHCFHAPCIGNRTIFTSAWLDRTRRIYCSIAWIDIQLGPARRTKTVFACHSWLHSGLELHTAPMAPEDWNPEIVPSNHDIMVLAADVQPSHAIDRHRDRIAGRSDVRSFNRDTLMQELLRSSQEHFDELVARGFYSPLTDEETESLMSTNQRVGFRRVSS